jgi:hypothetical protein
VAFEADSQTNQEPISASQVHAATLLTGMLRSKYNLPAENCVTHAQVSVNPSNMRIGWHTDWGHAFPFADIGLPDNYEIPNPALYMFGFEYDQGYVNSTGPGIRKGLAIAQELTFASAAARGMTLAGYRHILQKRYHNLRAALEGGSADEEQRRYSD